MRLPFFSGASSDEMKNRMRSPVAGKKCIGCLVMVVLLCAVIGAIVYIFLRPQKSKDATLETQSSKTDLDELCSATSIATEAGRALCKDQCQVALCCYDPSDECPDSIQESCGKYAACKAVMNITAAQIPPAPSDLETICTADTITTEDGFADCEMACLEATCCWSEREENNCYLQQKEVCQSYDPCHFVNSGMAAGVATDFKKQPAANTGSGEEDVNHIFMDDDVFPIGDGFDEGQSGPVMNQSTSSQSFGDVGMNGTIGEVSMNATEVPGSTLDPKREFTTTATQSDNVVTNTKSPVTEAASVLPGTIHPFNMTGSANATAKETVTGDGTKLPETLAGTNKTTEIGYNASLTDFGTAAGDTYTTSFTETEAVEATCTVENIARDNGWEDCKVACSSRPCCFSTDEHFNCMDEYSDYCLDFSVCIEANVTFSASEVLSILDNLSEVCSSANLETGLDGWSNCAFACEAKGCCETDTCTNMGFCGDYEICIRTFSTVGINLGTGVNETNDSGRGDGVKEGI